MVKNTNEANDETKERTKETAGKKEDGEEDDSEYEETGWLCDGSNKFKGGCKSGQTDFGEHEGTDFWSSSNKDEDFDLCEMCLRWCIYCEKNNLDIGWIDPSSPGKALVEPTQD